MNHSIPHSLTSPSTSTTSDDSVNFTFTNNNEPLTTSTKSSSSNSHRRNKHKDPRMESFKDPRMESFKETFTPGALVQITTALNDELRGTVYCFDTYYRTVALEMVIEGDNDNQYRTFSIVSTDQIQNAILIERNSDRPFPQPLEFDLTSIKIREVAARSVRTKEAAKIGHNVSKNAQYIFNMLIRTMKCQWEGDVIVVEGTVKIHSPYTTDNVYGGPPTSLSYIKQILNGIQTRMSLQQERT